MIQQIIITSLFTYGLYHATRVKFSLIEDRFTKKEILWFIKWYGDQHLPKWITKPLYDCPMCMASFWSLVLTVKFGLSLDLLITIPAVSGLNYILDRVMYSEE